MNNIQELIERLKKIANPVKGIDAVTSPKDRQAIKETITALESMQAPLPDDVTAMIDYQNSVALVYGNEHDRGIGDMLERLAYENQYHILARKQDKQRIEKQDKTMLAYESRIKRLDAALGEIETKYWKSPAGILAGKARAGE